MSKIKLSDLSLSEMFAYIKNGEERLQEILDEYPEGYVSHRKDGDYIKINREWHKIRDEYDSSISYQPGTSFLVKKDTSVRVDDSNEKKWKLLKGSEVTDIQHFAKGAKIRTVNYLRAMLESRYGIKTRVEDWTKSKGLGLVTNGIVTRFVELHWYDVRNVGFKFDMKEKIEEY